MKTMVDNVHMAKMLRAGPLKLAAYRVCDPETGDWSSLQYHMTYDNTVMAVMSEESAKLFANFVTELRESDHDEETDGRGDGPVPAGGV